MAIFEDIELEWEGEKYTIKGDDAVMRVLAAVEEHVTFMELQQGSANGKVPLAKLATAYAVVLRFAGCRISPAEVYNGMWKDGNMMAKIQEAITGLLSMMIPSSVMSQADPEGKPKQSKKASGGKS